MRETDLKMKVKNKEVHCTGAGGLGRENGKSSVAAPENCWGVFERKNG